MNTVQSSNNSIPPENSFSPDVQAGNKIKKIVLFGIVGLVIFVLLVVFFLLTKNSSIKKNKSSSLVPTPIPAVPQVRNAPTVHFDTYDLQTEQPVIGQTTKIYNYTLKENYSNADVTTFAQSLGIPTIATASANKSVVTASNITDPQNLGILVFDKPSGTFVYNSFGVLKPRGYSSSMTAQQTAMSMLSQLGVSDPTLVCTNTYQIQGDPQTVTFVECHRAWDKLGAPLVSFGGILNIPEQTKIDQLAVGATYPDSPDNKTITNLKSLVNTAQGENGKARPNDFNTVTVGVYPDGRIYSINSNLRLFDKQPQPVAVSDLLTPEEALSQFQQQKAQFSLTLPAGSGIVDWDAVYPNNQATANKATILDYELVYLENMPYTDQSSYFPYYLIRGSTQLNSGYTVKFAQVVPAQKSKLSQSTSSNATKAVAGVSTNPIKAGAFTPATPTPTPTRIPTRTPTRFATPTAFRVSPTQAVSITSTPTRKLDPTGYYSLIYSACSDEDEATDTKLTIPGYGELVIKQFDVAPHTFFFKSSTFGTDLEKARKALYTLADEQIVITVAKFIMEKNISLSSLKTSDDIEYLLLDTCKGGSNIQCVNSAMREIVTEQLKSKILAAAKDGTIPQLAKRQNLFPDATLAEFSYLYSYGADNADRTFLGLAGKCYLTGWSPSLFLYPQTKISVSVTTTEDITYNDPQFTNNNTWNVFAEPNGKITDGKGVLRNYLYYEYDSRKVVFSNQSTGFVIKISEWKTAVVSIAQKLGLNQPETEQLLHEVENALVGENAKLFLKISLVDSVSLDQKLPLTISPQPDSIYRIHLLLTPLNSNISVEPPLITPVNRTGFTAVELGARVGE